MDPYQRHLLADRGAGRVNLLCRRGDDRERRNDVAHHVILGGGTGTDPNDVVVVETGGGGQSQHEVSHLPGRRQRGRSPTRGRGDPQDLGGCLGMIEQQPRFDQVGRAGGGDGHEFGAGRIHGIAQPQDVARRHGRSGRRIQGQTTAGGHRTGDVGCEVVGRQPAQRDCLLYDCCRGGLGTAQLAKQPHAGRDRCTLRFYVLGAGTVEQQENIAAGDVGAAVEQQGVGASRDARRERGVGAVAAWLAVQIDAGKGGAVADDAGYVQTLAAVDEKAFSGVRQGIAVVGKGAVIQVAAKFACEIGETGHERRVVDGPPLRHPHHAGGARTHAFDGFVPRRHLFDVDSRCKVFWHVCSPLSAGQLSPGVRMLRYARYVLSAKVCW